jgi:GT2 family glycosyltransferase
LETKRGLASIYQSLNYYKINGSNELNFRIVVIDDGSVDGSSEWIKNNYPEIIILNGDGNLWWTGSINKGAKFSVEELKSDWILLWNDDTNCSEDYFFQLEKILRNNLYNNAILVSKIFWLNEDGKLFNFGCFFNNKTGVKVAVGYNEKDSDKYNSILKVDWSGGMGTLIPGSILVKLNYFDALNFPQYAGDSDFFLRAKKEGYFSYAIPFLKIYNNRDTTGIYKVKSFKDFKNLLFSNRSMYNFKQNFKFTKRHSNYPISWLRFCMIYCYHTIMLFLNLITFWK